jgi:hypothetical protein
VYIPGFAGRSTSLGSQSQSGSHSCSHSRGPSMMPNFQQGSSNPLAFTGRNMTVELRDRLVEELRIDNLFTDRTKTGIRFCWGRHTEITRAIDLARSIHDAGNWPVDLPNFNEGLIAEVFISKSAWYKYKNHFSLVKKHYPDMIDWLNQEQTGEEEDKEVWSDYRSKYTLEDLKEFLDLGGRLKKTRKQSRHSSDEDHSPSKGKGKSHKKKYNN